MEFEEPLHLEPCSFCGRKFAPESLHRHENICQKTSRKRPVFNSSKQRSVQGCEIKPQRSSNSLKSSNSKSVAKPSIKSNWRAKHEDFIRTVRAAREVSVAMKQGKELPPPPPPTINPDYVQCPHCMRRFNATAAERHIPFCAEQSKRLSNKHIVGNDVTKQAAAARAFVRQQYRPPMLRKKEKSIQTAVVSNQPSFSTIGSTRSSNVTTTQKMKKTKPEWDSTYDRLNERNDYSKTGLRPSSGTNYKPSSRNNYRPNNKVTRQPTKPVVRKIAGKKTSSFPEQSRHSNNVEHNSFSTKPQVKSSVKPGVISGRSGVAKLTTNSQPDFYDWLQPDDLHAQSGARQQTSKFCHECGTRFPVSNAKFCCECGVKRIAFK